MPSFWQHCPKTYKKAFTYYGYYGDGEETLEPQWQSESAQEYDNQLCMKEPGSIDFHPFHVMITGKNKQRKR